MEQGVNPSLYNEQYYRGRYKEIDFSKIVNFDEFEQIYKKSGSMLHLTDQDKVIDFGCGVGYFSLYLYIKYNCNIIGIDYSQHALLSCEKYLKALESRSEYSSIREKVRFLFFDSHNPSDFKGIKAVFLIDVVEHLYDHEFNFVLKEIKKWGDKIQIIIHTDNNYYLKFIRPVLDFLAVCFGKTTYRKLNTGYKEVAKGHVNLTTARKLKKKLNSHSFDILKIEYPSMNISAVKNQLGPIANHWFILYPIIFVGKIFYFLRPSFYMLAENKESF